MSTQQMDGRNKIAMYVYGREKKCEFLWLYE